MRITIDIPWAITRHQVRRLMAIISVFAPSATIRIGDYTEETLDNQLSADVWHNRPKYRPAEEAR